MSLRFSKVTIKSKVQTFEFLVGGIPASQKDLNPWNEFRRCIAQLQMGDSINLHVETFVYGDEEPYDATPEEVAYFYYRIAMKPDFIESRTTRCGEKDILIRIEK